MIDKKDITGIILAGGKSSRMGTDKGLLMLNNNPFAQYSIEALKPLVSDILIVSDNADYDVLGYKRINDNFKDAGPVSGIYSGLNASSTSYNLVLSCDIPLITTEVLQLLINATETPFEIIQAESIGKSMPLIAIYKKQVKDIFLKCLQNNERRLRFAMQSCLYKNVVLEKAFQHTAKNVNTLEDYKTLKHAYND